MEILLDILETIAGHAADTEDGHHIVAQTVAGGCDAVVGAGHDQRHLAGPR